MYTLPYTHTHAAGYIKRTFKDLFLFKSMRCQTRALALC
uniref:Uncharacterized protein n=1 Tax=Anguilla anguilla TaxID=7936 RepID=A0A0E9R165_ANGAN